MNQTRHRRDHRFASVVPSKRAKVVAPFAVDLERLIIAFGKQLWMPSSQLQKSADAEQLLAAVLPTSRKIGYRGGNDFIEQGPPHIPVD
jgi:hypothetical protein